MKTRYFLLFLLFFSFISQARAQTDNTLRLSLNRDIGASFGNQIQGTFSLRVEGPDNLARVVFFIDDNEIGNDNESPFRLRFNTGNYAIGLHTLHAVGFTADGRQITSNTLQREFIAGATSTRLSLYIIVPLVILIIGGRVISTRIANRSRQKAGLAPIHGFLGGTICPNCARPYAFHWWGFNFVTVRIDRCPYCGKWRIVKKYHPDVLEAAAGAMIEANKPPQSSHSLSPDEKLRRQLEDSRFDDSSANEN